MRLQVNVKKVHPFVFLFEFKISCDRNENIYKN